MAWLAPLRTWGWREEERRRSVFSSRKWNENRIDVRRDDGDFVARDGSATTIQGDIKVTWETLIGEKEASESISKSAKMIGLV